MRVGDKHYRTVWMKGAKVYMIEQNHLPFSFRIYESDNYLQTCDAIRTMIVRGAGAIGVAAAYAMVQAIHESPENQLRNFVLSAKKNIESTRPTAQNLFTSTNRIFNALKESPQSAIIEADRIADEDVDSGRKIGQFGNALIRHDYNILTHCNAGWLAFADYGTALSPIYAAHSEGKNIFVYVDETRPRCQGARLTAWELHNENVPYAIIPDNAAAHLMSVRKIDMVITGADRIARNGDVANKIGTLSRAIAAKEYQVPFYVAAPLSTFDMQCISGKDIPIEERSEQEVLYQNGPDESGSIKEILVSSPGSNAVNPAFDVTPAKLIQGIITEKGIIQADETEIRELFR
jgi:methylthioribose-1-phosphate isomerase